MNQCITSARLYNMPMILFEQLFLNGWSSSFLFYKYLFAGPTPEELEEMRRLEEEARVKREAEEKAEKERKEAEELQERRRRQEEWVSIGEGDIFCLK